MIGIGKFFDKFNNVAIREIQKREAICDILFKTTKQKFDIADISITNGTISIKGNQSLKSEIFLKKQVILKALEKFKIKDIK